MMKRQTKLVLALSVFLGASSLAYGAVAFLYPLLVQDFKANGTALRYFNKQPSVHYWNFTGIPAAVPAISGTTMTVAGPVQFGTAAARPTCVAGLRGEFYNVQEANNPVLTDAGVVNSDGGVKDLVYQCCKNAATTATYSWVAKGCQ